MFHQNVLYSHGAKAWILVILSPSWMFHLHLSLINSYLKDIESLDLKSNF